MPIGDGGNNCCYQVLHLRLGKVVTGWMRITLRTVRATIAASPPHLQMPQKIEKSHRTNVNIKTKSWPTVARENTAECLSSNQMLYSNETSLNIMREHRVLIYLPFKVPDHCHPPKRLSVKVSVRCRDERNRPESPKKRKRFTPHPYHHFHVKHSKPCWIMNNNLSMSMHVLPTVNDGRCRWCARVK